MEPLIKALEQSTMCIVLLLNSNAMTTQIYMHQMKNAHSIKASTIEGGNGKSSSVSNLTFSNARSLKLRVLLQLFLIISS